MKYTYVAKIHLEDGVYMVDFPDLPNCFTSGETVEEAMEMAEDVLPLMLCGAEDAGKDIPAPTPADKIERGEGDILAAVRADTVAYRRRYKGKAKQKMISIPEWMDDMIKERNISLSNFVQNALARELGVEAV